MVIESINLKIYKKQHGRENQFFITSYIGIDLIKSVDDKPSDLNTSWYPQNIDNAKEEARLFIQRSSLVYSVSAFEAYLSDFIQNQVLPLSDVIPKELEDAFLGKSIIRKIERLVEEYPDLKTKEYYLVHSTICWRNKLIHGTRDNFSGEQKGKLRKHKDEYISSYCNLNINDYIIHYNENKVPTFKETLSMMTNLRNYAAIIDHYFMSQFNIEKYITYNIKNLIDAKKIKNFDFSSNSELNSRFWRNVFEIRLRLNVNKEIQTYPIWHKLISAKNRQELDEILHNCKIDKKCIDSEN